MKKILFNIFIVLIALVLVGCGQSDEKKLKSYLNKISIETEVTENFYLPSSVDGLNDHSISWESSNTKAIKVGNLATVDGANYYNAKVTRSLEDVEVELTATVEMASGLTAQKSFRVTVIHTDEDPNAPITVAEAIASNIDATVNVKGVVSGFHYSGTDPENKPTAGGCYITDETGTIYVYGYVFSQGVKKGDEVIVNAIVGEYNGYKQLTSPTLNELVGSGKEIPTSGAKTNVTLAQIAGDLSSNYASAAYIFENVTIVKITGADYVSYAIEDANGNAINLYSSIGGVEFSEYDQYVGKEVKLLFAINSQNSKKTKWRGHILEVLEVVGDWNGSQGGGNIDVPTDAKKATITEILSLAANLADKEYLEGNYEATGTVTKIDEAYSSQYKNITFTLSDGTSEILCYRTKGTEAANVAVGDTITIVGQVQKYGEKIEFAMATITARTAGEGGGNQGGNEGGDTPEPGTLLTVKGAIACATGSSVKVQGIVSGFHYGKDSSNNPSISGCYITDETGTIYVYGYIFAQSVQKGDEVIVEGSIDVYNGYKQIASPTLSQTLNQGQTTPIEGAVTNKTLAQIAGDLTTNYASAAYIFENVTIVKVIGSGYVNYVVEDANGNAINLYSSADSSEFSVYDQYIGKEVKLLFAINSQNSKKTKWRGHILEVLEVVGDWNGSQGGGNTDTPTTPTDANYVTEVQTGVAYKLGIDQATVGVVVYIDGQMSGFYGATTQDFASAKDVYLEEVTGGYNLYFMNGSAKKYIVVVVSGTYKNYTIADAPSTVWSFDTAQYTLTTMIDGVKYYMGTYNTFTTVSVSDYDKYVATSFPCRLYKEGAETPSQPSQPSQPEQPSTPSVPSGELPEIVIADKVITGGTYIPDNSQHPDPQFYSNGGLKVNYVGIGVLTPTFDAQNSLKVTLTIKALNANQKSENSATTDALTVYGLDASGNVVATASTNAIEVGDIEVTLEGTGIVQIKVIMTDYYNDGTVCYNINLGGVKVSK